MKPVLIVLGVLLFLGLACCGGIFFIGKGAIDTVKDNNNQADVFSAKILTEIASDWNPETVLKYASPEFKDQVPDEKLKSFLASYKQSYGKFKSVGEFTASNFHANASNGDSSYQVTTNATATFEKGTARVELIVIKRKDEWKLLSMELKN
jgi:hypothetical protein